MSTTAIPTDRPAGGSEADVAQPDGEKAERIIEYLDPDSTHQNVVAAVGSVTAERKTRVL